MRKLYIFQQSKNSLPGRGMSLAPTFKTKEDAEKYIKTQPFIQRLIDNGYTFTVRQYAKTQKRCI